MTPQELMQMALQAPDQLAALMAEKGMAPPQMPPAAPQVQTPDIPSSSPSPQLAGANPILGAPTQAPVPQPRPNTQAQTSPGAGAEGQAEEGNSELMRALSAVQSPPGPQVNLSAPGADRGRPIDPAFQQILQQMMQRAIATKAPESQLSNAMRGF